MDTSSIPLKRCSKKSECIHPEAQDGWLPATTDYFNRASAEKDGLRHECKYCSRSRQRKYYANDPEPHRARSRKYTSENLEKRVAINREYRAKNREWSREQSRKNKERHPDYHAKYFKQYYAKNREKQLEQARDYYKKNSVRIRLNARKWAKNNRDKRRVHHNNREARKLELPNTFSSTDWQHALEYFNECCAVCGRPPGLWHILAQEHWIALDDPRPDNPGTVSRNILPICHSIKDGEGGCNNSKWKLDPIDWLNRKFGKHKAKQILARIQAYFDSLS